MKFELDTTGTTTVLTFKEQRLDSANAAELKSQFILISNTDNEHLLIDIGQVTMADSSGISSLLMAYRIYRDSDRIFLICNIHENVKKLLEITQLDKVFLMFDTVEEGMEYIKKSIEESNED